MNRILTSSGGVCVPRSDHTLGGFSNPNDGPASAPAPFRMPDKRIDDAFCHAGPRGISKEDRPELFRATHAVVADMTREGSLRGACECEEEEKASTRHGEQTLTCFSHAAYCAGKGGHDVSGHTFILILSSLLLLEELTPYLAQYFSAVLPPSLSANIVSFIPRSLRATKDPYRRERAGASIAATSFVLALVGLWLFSLVNTS